MDFRLMLNNDQFAYFTDQEKEYLLTVYLPRRGSDFSRSNLLYILGAFSTQLEKPLFEVSMKDASLYTNFLIGNIEERSGGSSMHSPFLTRCRIFIFSATSRKR